MNRFIWVFASVVNVWAAMASLSAAESPDSGSPVPAEEQKAYSQLVQRGVLIQPIATASNWYYVNFRGADKPDSSLYGLLKNAVGIVDLDLSGQKLSEPDCAVVGSLKNLRKLNLSKSAVTDAGLTHLKSLSKLESLNLFQTEVTDAGLGNLKSLAAIRRIYVYQTKVTDAGVDAVKAAIPNVVVEKGGVVLAPPKKEEAKKDDKKEAPAN